MAVVERRRLPVLQTPKSAEPPPEDDPDAPPPRPPWQWVGFGTVAIFAAWLPLAYVAQAAIERAVSGRFGIEATRDEIASRLAAMDGGERARLMALLALPNVIALAGAALGGGYVVGRFGAGTGPREAATAGAMTAIVALTLSATASGLANVSAIASALVTAAVAIGFAGWGGSIGRRRRVRAASPPA